MARPLNLVPSKRGNLTLALTDHPDDASLCYTWSVRGKCPSKDGKFLPIKSAISHITPILLELRICSNSVKPKKCYKYLKFFRFGNPVFGMHRLQSYLGKESADPGPGHEGRLHEQAVDKRH